MAFWKIFFRCGRRGGHLSSLEIDSDDTYSIIGKTEKCDSVNISINYLDRDLKRTILVHTNDDTYLLDMVNSTLFKNREVLEKGEPLFETYQAQAKNILDKTTEDFCSLGEGNSVLKLIEAIETSVKESRFVTL